MNKEIIDNDGKLTQDIYHCMYSGVLSKREYVGGVRRCVEDFYKHGRKNFTISSNEFNHESYSCITYSEKTINKIFDKISNVNIPSPNSDPRFFDYFPITIYKLSKGIKIPDSFKIDIYKENICILHIGEQKCTYHKIHDILDEKYMCVTYDSLTNLDWKFHGYFQPKNMKTHKSFVSPNDKNTFEFSWGNIKLVDEIYDIMDNSSDINNRIDTYILCYLTKNIIKNYGKIYSYLFDILCDYDFYADDFNGHIDDGFDNMKDFCKNMETFYDNLDKLLILNIKRQINKQAVYKMLLVKNISNDTINIIVDML